MPPVISEGNRLNDVLFWENGVEVRYSRDQVVVVSGQDLSVGHVIGRTLLTPTVAGAASAGNTGNGTIGSVTAGTAAQRGRYRAVCVEPAANGGSFSVFDPKGRFIGQASVGSAFSNEVGFTISDGATDFVVGDSFIVDVTAGSYKVKEYDPAATDGAKRVAGVLGQEIDATAADKKSWMIARDAIVKTGGLVWKSGLTADQKTAGLDELSVLGIIARTDA